MACACLLRDFVRSVEGKHRAVWVWLLALALPTLACEREEHDILVDSELLAEGDFHALAWGGTQVERFHVVAHRGTRDGEVVVISPQQEAPCSLGSLDGYLALQPANSGKYVLGSPSPARIGLFDRLDEDGYGRVGFAGVDCKRIPLEITDVDPDDIRRLQPTDLTELSFAVTNRDGALLFVSPWAEKQRTIARDVQSLRTQRDGLWLIEAGKLVRRDLDGVEQERFGTGVTEMLPLSEEGDIAWVDDRGLVVRRKGELTKVDPEACRVRSLGGFIPQSLGFLSPCETRNLVLRTVDGEEHRYDFEVGSAFAQDGRLLFTVDVEDRTQVYLVLPSDLDEPVLLAEGPSFEVQSVWRTGNTEFRLAVRVADGTLELWRVNAADPGAITVLLDEVVALSTYERGMVVVREDESLQVLDRTSLRMLVRAKGVRRSGYRFVFGGTATAVAYIHDTDPDTGLGKLSLRFLTGEHFDLDDQVREFKEVWWPESGLLYATGGKGAALRFGRVDVPCEKTSDSPWACGF
jgi:hypothetical protein